VGRALPTNHAATTKDCVRRDVLGAVEQAEPKPLFLTADPQSANRTYVENTAAGGARYRLVLNTATRTRSTSGSSSRRLARCGSTT